ARSEPVDAGWGGWTYTYEVRSVDPPVPAADEKTDKVGFWKTVAQGFRHFWSKIKEWLTKDGRVDSFKALGRKFADWFRGVKAKLSFKGKAVQEVGEVGEEDVDGTNESVHSAGEAAMAEE